MGRLAGACTLFLGICLAALPAGAAQRVALVVGNSDYELISPLANPANDAALMAETLRGVGFEVVEVKNADRRGMARAIRDFGKRLRGAGRDAVGLFYYAGHGVQAAGTNYLIPLGAPVETEADLEIEAVSAAWVLGQMEYAGNALNVVILDACRNNPFKGAFRAATRGLARMNAPSGSLVAYAAAPGQVAADGITDNSPYTAALVAAMKEPGLPLEQVFKRVRVAVEAATGEQQTPWEESSLKGDFYFVPQGSTVTVTPPGAPPIQSTDKETLFWQSVRASSNVALYEAYLSQFPNGTFATLAKAKIDELRKKTETATLTPPPQPADEPAFAVTEMDETYYALKRSNVREGPGIEYGKVGRLNTGDEVEVTGQVEGKEWYRIALPEGTEAYVFAGLLNPDRSSLAGTGALGRYENPWDKRLFSDNFSGAGPKPDPPWQVTTGEIVIDRRYGLHSIIKQSGADDIGFAAAILPLKVESAFSLRVVLTSRMVQGVAGPRFEFGPYQGANARAGYRLAYTPNARAGTPSLELLRLSSRGTSTLELTDKALKFEDGKSHVIEWTRDRGGRMVVKVDGAEVINVTDRSFRDAFDGIALVNSGGDYALRSIAVAGTSQ
jgi:uncharacterized caspase-like protein